MLTGALRRWLLIALVGIYVVAAGVLIWRFVATPESAKGSVYTERAELTLSAGEQRQVWVTGMNRASVDCAVVAPDRQRTSVASSGPATTARYDGVIYLKAGELTATQAGAYQLTCTRSGFAGWGPAQIRVGPSGVPVSLIVAYALLGLGGAAIVGGGIGAGITAARRR